MHQVHKKQNARQQKQIDKKQFYNSLKTNGVTGMIVQYSIDYKLFQQHQDIQKETIENIIKKIPTQENGKLNLNEIKLRLRKLTPGLDVSILNSVFEGMQEIGAQDIIDLLGGDHMVDFDPLQESLKLIAEDSGGILDLQKMSDKMVQLKYNKLDKQDQIILLEILDINKNRKLDTMDLKEIFTLIQQQESFR
ncbi:hypothetical protein pb186bvf_013230 [Paramecium bursaria]